MLVCWNMKILLIVIPKRKDNDNVCISNLLHRANTKSNLLCTHNLDLKNLLSDIFYTDLSARSFCNSASRQFLPITVPSFNQVNHRSDPKLNSNWDFQQDCSLFLLVQLTQCDACFLQSTRKTEPYWCLTHLQATEREKRRNCKVRKYHWGSH